MNHAVAGADGPHPAEPPDKFDVERVTLTAADHFRVPVAHLTLIDDQRQWFTTRFGIDAPAAPREAALCTLVGAGTEPLVVRDARYDERLSGDPALAGDEPVVAFAGVPVTNREGVQVGILCLIDHQPRTFSPKDVQQLVNYRRWLELVIGNKELDENRARLETDLDAARRDSLLDPLTKLWNRRGFSSIVARELAKASREQTPIALAMIDIDHFKRVNDTYGHQEGDKALVLLAEILREKIRGYDAIARVGGEEFAILLPGVQAANAAVVAEKIRAAVEAGAVLANGARFTISVGLGWFDPQVAPLSEELMVARADDALYRAKRDGRNRAITDLGEI